MSVLVFAENWEGKFKKSTYEAISYGAEIAKQLGGTVAAVVIGKVSEDDMKSLGKYGAQKVLSVSNDKLIHMNPTAYAAIVAQAAQKENSKVGSRHRRGWHYESGQVHYHQCHYRQRNFAQSRVSDDSDSNIDTSHNRPNRTNFRV